MGAPCATSGDPLLLPLEQRVVAADEPSYRRHAALPASGHALVGVDATTHASKPSAQRVPS